MTIHSLPVHSREVVPIPASALSTMWLQNLVTMLTITRTLGRVGMSHYTGETSRRKIARSGLPTVVSIQLRSENKTASVVALKEALNSGSHRAYKAKNQNQILFMQVADLEER